MAESQRGGGRFEVRECIGRGASGSVYRAFDLEHRREVALKRVASLGPEQRYLLKREFRALSALTHPNLVRLHDLVVEGDDCFYTMELVEGRDALASIRGDAGPGDALSAAGYQRLRHALRQLVRGVGALHAAGKLHCDIKPSNVLLDPRGRLVLLDMGLVREYRGRHAGGDDRGHLVGTLAYASPEQCWGEALGPASDWYSVGVLLYEALTGRLPFSGNASRQLATRREDAIPRASRIVPDCPEDLESLACELGHPDPARRPSHWEVLHRTKVDDPSGGPPAATAPGDLADDVAPAAVHAPIFVGRDAELAALHRGHTALARGRRSIVHIAGRSGIGKTALLERFAHELAGRQRTLLLYSRCLERETLPFRALDGVIDELSRHLLRHPDEILDVLDTTQLAALTRLFPVLGRVARGAEASAPALRAPDAAQLRRAAFDALARVLARVSRDHRIVIAIDDLQWGDVDSMRLLEDLFANDTTPALLLLLCFRSDERSTSPALRRLLDRRRGSPLARPTERIELGPMARAQTESLVRTLLERRGEYIAPERARSISQQSGGNPFLALELAHVRRECASDDEEGAGDLRAVVAGRLASLSRRERTLLETLAVSGSPTSISTLRQIAGDSAAATLRALEAHSLARASSSERGTRWEIYHSRLREVVLEVTDDERQRRHHYRLAITLEADPDAGPHRLVDHFEAAGERARAARHAIEAARHAEETLALDLAIELYERGLDLGGGEMERGALLAALGRVCADAGRGHRAARAFEEAARELAVLRPPDDAQLQQLRRRAAESYMRAGRYAEGIAASREVLRHVGVPFPENPRHGILRAALWTPLSIFARSLRRCGRAPRATTASRARLDALWSVALGMAGFDVVRAAGIQARYAYTAFRCGDTVDVARVLSNEATLLEMRGGERRRRRAHERRLEARRPAEQSGSATLLMHLQMNAATAALYGNRWRESVAHADRCAEIWRGQARSGTWEFVGAQIASFVSLAYAGELIELERRLEAALADAQAWDDQRALRGYQLGMPNLVWAALGDAGSARRRVEQSLRGLEHVSFGLPHYHGLLASVQLDLFEGDPAGAWLRLRDQWRPLLRSGLLFADFSEAEMRGLRARGAIARAAQRPPEARHELLGEAQRELQRLRRLHCPASAPLADAAEAGVLATRGEHSRALAALERAAAGFEALDMSMHLAATRLRIHAESDSGSDALERALGWSRRQHVTDPERIAAALVPGDFGAPHGRPSRRDESTGRP